MERDICTVINVNSVKYFNSHAHVERDQNKTRSFTGRNYFNSHAHVERDDRIDEAEQLFIISTHTLTWSVTYGTSEYPTSFTFQLTRSRGA